ncbi:sigma-70 family RNA polymerase sigma factor [Saccharibacillus sacchari]|uniref:Sigma-70 family RNA polymerase sigma factor n=1 Tax=Saccharibacillus sacchari TaxID=456493 RepID=A0ACC6PG97_9BACL
MPTNAASQSMREQETDKARNTQRDKTGSNRAERSDSMLPAEEWYIRYRKYAFAIAYRMLGSAESAEDAVQDCFAELHRRKPQHVEHIKSYIARMITNACLNMLNSARYRKETYLGEWLPEPIGGEDGDPEAVAERRDMLSYAYLVLLDRLSPAERAVFVLREAFQYDYAAIAGMTDRTEAGCRQIYSRVKRSLQAEPAVTAAPSRRSADFREARAGLLHRFAEAFAAHDVDGMLQLLAEQPVFTADGGGRELRTIARPMVGRKGVLALLTSRRVFASLRQWEYAFEPIGGEPQLVFRHRDRVMATLCFSLDESAEGDLRIRDLFLMLADEKLSRI